MNLAEYYASELNFLRETARAFAQEHPALAGALQERGTDPDVERLLEGVAFMTAGLRARIDQTGAQVAHGLAELVLPHYLRSLPATTVVEFLPNPKTLRLRQHVPAERPLLARAVDGTACRFRTCFPVDLWPLTVGEIRIDDSLPRNPRLDLQLELFESGRVALADPQPLRFYIHHADAAVTTTLLLWLTEHLSGITVLTGTGVTHRLPAESVRVLPTAASAVLPWLDSAPVGYRSVLEFFALPEKFYFFELSGLHTLALADPKLTVQFEFERPPPLPAALGPTPIRLHCTPAINLFEAPGEPLTRGPLTRESLVRADGIDPRHMEVYEVRSAIAVSRTHGGRRSFVPFARAGHVNGGMAPAFSLRRALSPVDEGIDTYISLIDPPDARAGLDEEVVSLQLLCTNRALPGNLHLGDIQEDLRGALYRGYTNITPVAPPVRMALGSDALWRLLSHLALNQRGPADAESLRGLLHLYNFHGAANAQRGRLSARTIDAVRDVRREAVTRLVRGVPIRTVRTTVELDERGFLGLGHARLFGCVLDDLYGSHININVASELRTVLSPSRVEFTWPVRIGD
ncbi:MAG: type VI secretion system baseplate subunit TssF [Gemmatimonadales bacterium]|nr:type VI secretion system baseplate subunit TssF [Gemmatimonadales bacterium]